MFSDIALIFAAIVVAAIIIFAAIIFPAKNLHRNRDDTEI